MMCARVARTEPYVPGTLSSSWPSLSERQRAMSCSVAQTSWRIWRSIVGVTSRTLGLQERAATLDEAAAALPPEELVLVDDHLAAREDRRRLALHLTALVWVVVDTHVVRLRRQRLRRLRIPHHDVGVAADRDRALLREHAHELRGRGRGELDPAVERDALRHHASVVQQHHARLDARRAVRDLREVAFAELLLLREALEALLHAERAVVGRHDLQVVLREALPELLLVPPLAQRRAHHVLRPVEAGLVVVVDREEEVLRARRGVRREPAVAEEAHLLERLRGGEVDDVQRDPARHLGEAERAVCGLALGLGRPRERVPLRRGVLLGEGALHQ